MSLFKIECVSLISLCRLQLILVFIEASLDYLRQNARFRILERESY
jgi:hypothetical protein